MADEEKIINLNERETKQKWTVKIFIYSKQEHSFKTNHLIYIFSSQSRRRWMNFLLLFHPEMAFGSPKNSERGAKRRFWKQTSQMNLNYNYMTFSKIKIFAFCRQLTRQICETIHKTYFSLIMLMLSFTHSRQTSQAVFVQTDPIWSTKKSAVRFG